MKWSHEIWLIFEVVGRLREVCLKKNWMINITDPGTEKGLWAKNTKLEKKLKPVLKGGERENEIEFPQEDERMWEVKMRLRLCAAGWGQGHMNALLPASGHPIDSL